MQAKTSESAHGRSRSLLPIVESKDATGADTGTGVVVGRGGSLCRKRHPSVWGRSCGMASASYFDVGMMATNSSVSRTEIGQTEKIGGAGHQEKNTQVCSSGKSHKRVLRAHKDANDSVNCASSDLSRNPRKEYKIKEAPYQVTGEGIDFKAENVNWLLAAHSECDLARLLRDGASEGSSSANLDKKTHEVSACMNRLPTSALRNRTPNSFSSGARNSTTNCKKAEDFRQPNAFTTGKDRARTVDTIKTSSKIGTPTVGANASAAAAAAALFPASVALQFEVIDAEMVASMERIHCAKARANLRDEEIESRSRAVVRQRMAESSTTLDREKRKAERRLNALVGLRL